MYIKTRARQLFGQRALLFHHRQRQDGRTATPQHFYFIISLPQIGITVEFLLRGVRILYKEHFNMDQRWGVHIVSDIPRILLIQPVNWANRVIKKYLQKFVSLPSTFPTRFASPRLKNRICIKIRPI
jgi:hypothetical protein